MLVLYRLLTRFSAPILKQILKKRLESGKEDPARVSEKQGIASIDRPSGSLIWLHAASVGETQSALVLIERLLEKNENLNILVTSGTVTSANLMAKRLPERAFHQYAPLDHPKWVRAFLEHWKPDAALWLESELWPNMLKGLKKKRIPAVLINARLSDASFRRWSFFKGAAKVILSSFKLVLTQTERDKERFEKLEAKRVFKTGNIKHCAAPLPYNEQDLQNLKEATNNRQIWVYASTHDGEEILAGKIHKTLQEKYPNLLTIVVPRHPERRDDVIKQLSAFNIAQRSKEALINEQTEIYLADTLGELGLFYKASPIAMIGRSFSLDGGGGHNPIEAAQLGCAVLTGPNIQYQQDLYNDMIEHDAVKRVTSEKELLNEIDALLSSSEALKQRTESAINYSTKQLHIIDDIMAHLHPILKRLS